MYKIWNQSLNIQKLHMRKIQLRTYYIQRVKKLPDQSRFHFSFREKLTFSFISRLCARNKEGRKIADERTMLLWRFESLLKATFQLLK